MKPVVFFTLLFLSISYIGFNLLNAEETGVGLKDFQRKSDNPVELGHVNWLRNFDEAKAKALKENKISSICNKTNQISTILASLVHYHACRRQRR